jgi:hypothetical protein
MNDGHTSSLPVCEQHPHYMGWPEKNLILGSCPVCGQHIGDDPAAVRELRARRLIAELEDRPG